MNYQVVGFGGNVVADAKSTEKVTNFSVAVNSGYGEKKRTAFFNCVAFKGSFSEKMWAAVQKLGKGSVVEVKGEFITDTWEKDGQKRSSLKFIVNSLNFGHKPSGDKKQEKAPATKEAGSEPEDDNIPF